MLDLVTLSGTKMLMTSLVVFLLLAFGWTLGGVFTSALRSVVDRRIARREREDAR